MIAEQLKEGENYLMYASCISASFCVATHLKICFYLLMGKKKAGARKPINLPQFTSAMNLAQARLLKGLFSFIWKLVK